MDRAERGEAPTRRLAHGGRSCRLAAARRIGSSDTSSRRGRVWRPGVLLSSARIGRPSKVAERSRGSISRFGVGYDLMEDRIIRSPLFPGGDLVAAALDRSVMTLADAAGRRHGWRRWADVVAATVERWPTADVTLPGRHPLHVSDVLRLDATPQIAATASRHGLQNPDWLLFGTEDGERRCSRPTPSFRSKPPAPARSARKSCKRCSICVNGSRGSCRR